MVLTPAPAAARPEPCAPPAALLHRALALCAPLLLGLVAWLGSLDGAAAAPGSGALLLRGKLPQSAPVEAPRLKTDIAVAVSGPTARATITQLFRNTTDQWVEGTYVYPLPEDAAVDAMTLVVGDRVIVADIRARAAARQAYEAAREAGHAAALTEQERPNLFTNSVANIGPGETVLVQIAYQQPVRLSGGTHALRIPLVVAPRYNPAPAPVTPAAEGAGADPVPDRARITPPVLDPAEHAPANPVTLTVTLQAGFPLGSVQSATHPIRVEETGPESRRVTLADGPVPADRDIELTWTAAPARAPAIGLFRERVGTDEYLLAVVTPPEGQNLARRPRDVTFVIDNSGSMAGASMRQAKASLLMALDRLAPADRFNVIRFDNTMDQLFPEAVPADERHLAVARSFVAALEARGGTEMLAPLTAALADPTPERTDRVRQIVFLTDGAIGNEEQIFSAIAAGRGRSRLFMIGIGSAPNAHLMTYAAELGRGSYTAIGTIDQVAERMRELLTKLESPVVTDLTASFSEPGVEATPRLLPDLYRGEPVVLAARLGRSAGTLTLRGRIGDRPWEQVLRLAQAEEGQGISKVWARAKIGEAETARLTGRLSAEAADAVILSLALEHRLMTRLTSLVAVDVTPRRPTGTPLTAADLPLTLPAGWDFEAVFGRSGAAQPAQPARERRAQVPSPLATAASGIALPQTASDAPLLLWLGLSLLAASALILRRPGRVA
ncbi:marine proteobacterial sortase target protein [Methylobacterium nodulans]|uniref:LPXTG-motif cell wall anchor domain protein n=1 Tax=Methylobacterium nodulans (strain LMG 21967 / CNCM I-2342 / ORS 2060) TaxID=460265 RepID=B8IP45_METNO|nr:marine proteobacterial sortase target protein [Methylobacterium nodulans]ACL60363.1 LPXTG-motif cell wall anchor domain protein [Methylobacterium nodulans ORS 2060]